MDGHLDSLERNSGNKRNGKCTKTIKSSAGNFQIETPQDRHSSFKPQLFKKFETVLADSLQDKIIDLNGLGMSLRDISADMKEMYDTVISHLLLAQIISWIINQVGNFLKYVASKDKLEFMRVFKSVYIATRYIEKKWTTTLQNWGLTTSWRFDLEIGFRWI